MAETPGEKQTAKDLFREKSGKIINCIATCSQSVTNALYDAKLITHESKEKILSKQTDTQKASELLNVIQLQLLAHTTDPDLYLTEICRVFKKQDHTKLSEIAVKILHLTGYRSSCTSNKMHSQRCLPNSCVNNSCGEITVGNIVYNKSKSGFIQRGSYACVYSGYLKDNGRQVAVKEIFCLNNDTILDEVKRLVECDSHENIVQYFCHSQDPAGTNICVAMEYCLASLREYVQGNGKEKLQKLRLKIENKEILKDAVKGLQHLHSLNIVHRDIKPGNILLTRRSSTEVKAVLSDFGISTQIEVGRSAVTTVNARGTSGWKAPELCFCHDDRKICTTAVDIFALGCVIYYVLSSGGHPFVEESRNNLEDDAHYNIKKEAKNHSENYGSSYPLETLPAGCESNAAVHLITQAIARKPDNRLSARQVLSHYYFWSKKEQLEYLLEVSKFLDCSPCSDSIRKEIEPDASSIVIGDDGWKASIGATIVPLADIQKYDGKCFVHLLRAIKNMKHHHHELPADTKKVLGHSCETFLNYFLTQFPSLLVYTYDKCKDLSNLEHVCHQSVEETKSRETLQWADGLKSKTKELSEKYYHKELQYQELNQLLVAKNIECDRAQWQLEENKELQKLQQVFYQNEFALTNFSEHIDVGTSTSPLPLEEQNVVQNEEEDVKTLNEANRVIKKQKQMIDDMTFMLSKEGRSSHDDDELSPDNKRILYENIQNLKNQISNKDQVIATLMKRRHQDTTPVVNSVGVQFDTSIVNFVGIQYDKPVLIPVGVQFDYTIPSIDSLDCICDEHIAGKRLFIFHKEASSHILKSWERYGLNIGVPKGVLSPSNTVEVSVLALVGGRFKFPISTNVVSAVYSISISSGPLLQPLKLEVQHCVNLTKTDQTKSLKFAIAPIGVSSNLFCEFSAVEGGQFTVGSQYGLISLRECCLVCVVGELNDSILNEEEPGQYDEKLVCNTNQLLKQSMSYAGLIYYEQYGTQADLVNFIAIKNLNVFLEFVKVCGQAEVAQYICFSFAEPHGFIEMKLDAPQRKPCTGWNIDYLLPISKLYQDEIDKFGQTSDHCLDPPKCVLSIHGSTNATPLLNYEVPLMGVASPISLFIHRILTTTPPVTPSDVTVCRAISVLSYNEGRKDYEDVQKIIQQVLLNKQDLLHNAIEPYLDNVVCELKDAAVISQHSSDYNAIIESFLQKIKQKHDLFNISIHCGKFLSILHNVGGTVAEIANQIREEWLQTVKNELDIELFYS